MHELGERLAADGFKDELQQGIVKAGIVGTLARRRHDPHRKSLLDRVEGVHRAGTNIRLAQARHVGRQVAYGDGLPVGRQTRHITADRRVEVDTVRVDQAHQQHRRIDLAGRGDLERGCDLDRGLIFERGHAVGRGAHKPAVTDNSHGHARNMGALHDPMHGIVQGIRPGDGDGRQAKDGQDHQGADQRS